MTAHDRTAPGKKTEKIFARVFVDRNGISVPLHRRNEEAARAAAEQEICEG